MRNGKVPGPISRSLPTGEFGLDYAPDGLTKAAIDVLLEEVFGESAPVAPRPSWLAGSDPVETRRGRRTTRQVVRLLPSLLIETDELAGSGESEAA